MRKPRLNANRLTVKVGTIITSISLADALFAGMLFQDWVIIEFGVRVYVLNLQISIGSALAGIAVMIIGDLSIFLEHRNAQRAATQQSPTEDLTSPEYTFKRLKQLQGIANNPHEPSITQGINQMVKMDELQARLATLIKFNEASYLQDTIEVLDKVEKHLCRNLIKVINLFIAAGNPHDVNLPKVQQYLQDNEKKLSDSQTLLNVAASWINQYETDHSNYDEIETWITTIRESLKED